MAESFGEKLRSLSFPRKLGQVERKYLPNENTGKIGARTDTHWDGRQDATVFPECIRYGARVHETGKQKGETAEIRKLAPKEKAERYGE